MSLRTDVMTVLRSPNCGRINFQIGSIRVYGGGYRTIATCIENRQIQVVRALAVPSTVAAYNRRYDLLILGTTPSPNLVVHECTHALNDWHRRNILAVEDEVSAYIAQMMFLFLGNPALATAIQQPQVRQRTEQVLQQCRADSQFCNTAAIGEASLIAAEILAGRSPTPATLQALRTALGRDPNTQTDLSNPRRSYDGIHRTEIPATYLQQLQGTVIDN